MRNTSHRSPKERRCSALIMAGVMLAPVVQVHGAPSPASVSLSTSADTAALERPPMLMSQAQLEDALRQLGTAEHAAPTASTAPPPATAASAAAQVTTRTWRHPRLDQLPRLLKLPPRLSARVFDKEGAGEGAPVGALRLEQSMRKGIDESFDTRAATAKAEAADQMIEASKGMLRPKLDLLIERGRGDLMSPDGMMPRMTDSVIARFPLIDRAVSNDVMRQQELASSALAQAKGAQSTAALEAASAYLQALQSRLVIELSGTYEGLLKEVLEYVSARAEGGGSSRADRDRVRARVANARSTIADSRANLVAALRKLESLVGQAPEWLVMDAPEEMRLPATAEEARAVAMEGNFDLQSAAAERDAARHEADSYRAKSLPRIELQLIHRRDINSAGMASLAHDNRVMVSMSWSLLNGGTDQAQMTAALARGQAADYQRASALRKISQDIDAAYATLDSMTDRFDAVREEVQANTNVVEAFRAQLVGGNRPLLDVLDAYQRLHQSRLDLVQLSITEAQNFIRISNLTGELPGLLAAPSVQR